MLCLRILVQAGYTGNRLLRAQEKGVRRGVWWGLGLVGAVFGQAPMCRSLFYGNLFPIPAAETAWGLGYGEGLATRLEGSGFDFTKFTPQVSSLYGRAG